MVITVDETCRAAYYPFIEWKKAFITGDITVYQDAASTLAVAPCIPIGTSSKWVYTINPHTPDCALTVTSEAGSAGNGMIDYWVYQAYLVYDQAIAAANGEGNLQQVDRTSIKCKIPKNFQENGAIGTVAIAEVDDIIPDYEDIINIWEEIKLSIFKGGYDDTTAGSTVAWASVAAGTDIGLGEMVKLELENTNSLTYITDYK